MTIFLIRHAQAGSRSRFSGDDRLRRLDRHGRHQAAELGELAELGQSGSGTGVGGANTITEVRSSPYRRCIETVAPLAAALGLPVIVDDSLAEGPGDAAIALVRSRWGVGAVLCSHGDVIPAVLDALVRADRLDLGPQPRCQKASVWAIKPSPDAPHFATATYLPPPRWPAVSS